MTTTNEPQRCAECDCAGGGADCNWIAPPLARGQYNDGYTHEALHTTHVLMETFADHVIDTRCADEFPEVKAAAEKAHQALFDLYQLIGMKFKE